MLALFLVSVFTLSQPSPLNLQPYHTFGLPQTACSLHLVSDLHQLQTLRAELKQRPYWLGEGANTIFVEPILRPIVKLTAQQVTIESRSASVCCHIEAGKDWHQLVAELTGQGIGGIENLALIPGTVGAAPIQNIGAYGVELADFCIYVDVFDWSTGEQRRLEADECQFSYRHSVFKTDAATNWLITAVGLELPKPWRPKLTYGGLEQLAKEQSLTPQQVMAQVIAVRQAKLPDPAQLGNAGSFFKNPTISNEQASRLLAHHPNMPHFTVSDGIKVPAAWLIDQLGWKGKAVGGAAVHDNQALVIINRGSAEVADVISLAWRIKQQVQQSYDIELVPEVRFLGANEELTLEQAYAQTHL
ncbi:UDP-N-acetylenolpyruvoylglucosamine reductase [Neiella marina]|uniref:UDP-N-acetylenolpyruvoylglucosamine reductase n=1 Tax=Neiella marina TaxID=508461 RepID=A0A8J2U7L5_9GAMM|nr:UDP-N-acetylmuramate dehydrogenase [Neiella marina]GGA84585.1 UDP-N-acetylenolpyruvoylglucosamine reductase [Neiella marina]